MPNKTAYDLYSSGELLSMVQDLKPEVIKSIRSVSPYLRGYRIPFFGKRKLRKIIRN